MRRLIETPVGWLDIELVPNRPEFRIAVFDRDGELVNELEAVHYNESNLAMFLIEAGVREDEADELAARLELEARTEDEEGPPPGWVPKGCLSGIAYISLTLGVWVLGFVVLVWLVVRLF